MDQDDLDALEFNDIESFKSIRDFHFVNNKIDNSAETGDQDEFTNHSKFTNSDEDEEFDSDDEGMYSEYHMLPSEDPEESIRQHILDIGEEEYERRKKESFESFDKNYERVTNSFRYYIHVILMIILGTQRFT